MTAVDFRRETRALLRDFERRVRRAPPDKVRAARARLRALGYYYVKRYTVEAHVRRLPKRRPARLRVVN